MQMFIPQRFMDVVDTHILGNILQIPDYPLILIISGAPGTGKTYQLEQHLMEKGVTVCSMSAVDMESSLSGEPVRILCEKYIEASDSTRKGLPSVLKIDDIDIMLGEWEKNTGTVNHQTLLAFLMHIADNPKEISIHGSVMSVERVPIIVTGNYVDKLYAPLIREGRARKFLWQPNREEKVKMLEHMSIPLNGDVAESLVDSFPSEEISFFSSVIANVRLEKLTDITRNIVFADVIKDSYYRNSIKQQYEYRILDISEEQIMEKAREMKQEDVC